MAINGKQRKIDYDTWSRSELIREIKKLEKRKKYGIVWDEERTKEIFEEQVQHKLPVLTEIKSNQIKSNQIKSNQSFNVLIEGDNYHALSVLNYTHRGKIDVIYIDPPFNTGNKTWKYNNNYVEKDDAFKHSKWLSFMEKRLRLAKSLLKSTGVIVVAIDDYEVHSLRCLMDEIFNENNRLGTIAVVHNPRGRNDDKYFATMHEYMLIYSKITDNASVGYFELTEKDVNSFTQQDDISKFATTSFMRTGNNSDRVTRPKLYYSIYYNPKTNNLGLEKQRDSIELLPINNSGEEKTWRWGQKTFLQKKDTELVVRNVKGNYKIFKKRRLIALKGKKPRTVWYDPKYDASSHGIMVLQNMFGKKNVFPYPKSIWANFDIMKLLTKKDSLVLDFFAGSGTLGHAISLLNNNDGGNRRFILCTNNENNICTEICYPRIEKAIKGYTNQQGKRTDGLGGNLKYFKTEFVSWEPTDKNKRELVRKSTEMLCLKEDCFELVKENEQYRIFKNYNDHYLGIIYYYDGIESFKKEVLELNKKINTYVFSLNDIVDEEEFQEVDQLVNLKPIPASILNVYRRIFAYVQTKKLPREVHSGTDG